MTVQRLESGVLFGDFEQDDLFEIEQASAVSNLGHGIRKVEFVYHQARHNRIIFLEAKSSCPRQSDAFIEEIKVKMLHSLSIWFAALSGRQCAVKDEIGKNLQKRAMLSKPIHFLLVIPSMPSEHCINLTHKLRKSLAVERRLWNIQDCHIWVLNVEKAKNYDLVSRNESYAHAS
jgi:hypothetical protein